jgi:hypothetical protein
VNSFQSHRDAQPCPVLASFVSASSNPNIENSMHDLALSILFRVTLYRNNLNGLAILSDQPKSCMYACFPRSTIGGQRTSPLAVRAHYGSRERINRNGQINAVQSQQAFVRLQRNLSPMAQTSSRKAAARNSCLQKTAGRSLTIAVLSSSETATPAQSLKNRSTPTSPLTESQSILFA